MEFEYGQAIYLQDEIDLNFWVDGIKPAGQNGYKETHYNILMDESSLIMSETLAKKVFQKKQPVAVPAEVKNSKTLKDLQKMKKSELIHLIIYERRSRSK